MSSSLPSAQGSRFWRVANICFAVVVLSYVSFDLLDLDGSNFSSLRGLRDAKTFVIAEIPLGTDAELCRVESGAPAVPTRSDRDRSDPPLRYLVTRLPKISSLLSVRVHGFRSGLPRGTLQPH